MNFENFLNHQNQPQPQEQEYFKEPELKNLDDFITYCSIFDPTISTQSARSIDRDNLLFFDQLYRDELIIKLFNRIGQMKFPIQSAINSGEGVLFLCDAPSYLGKPKEYSLKIVKDRFSQESKVNTTWQKLKKAQIYSLKTYAYFRASIKNQEFQRWLILKAPPTQDNQYKKHPKSMMGYGSTLPEADLEFHKARIKSFSTSTETIRFFVDNKIPLTQQRMFDICKSIDPDVDANTVAFRYREFSYPESSIFEFVCKSKIRKFSINIFRKSVHWQIVRFLRVEDEIYPITLKFYGQGKTLNEAFDMCEFQYKKCISNDKKLEEMIGNQQAKEMQEQIMRDNLEYENFFNDLIEEYGEDIIPDRD